MVTALVEIQGRLLTPFRRGGHGVGLGRFAVAGVGIVRALLVQYRTGLRARLDHRRIGYVAAEQNAVFIVLPSPRGLGCDRRGGDAVTIGMVLLLRAENVVYVPQVLRTGVRGGETAVRRGCNLDYLQVLRLGQIRRLGHTRRNAESRGARADGGKTYYGSFSQ